MWNVYWRVLQFNVTAYKSLLLPKLLIYRDSKWHDALIWRYAFTVCYSFIFYRYMYYSFINWIYAVGIGIGRRVWYQFQIHSKRNRTLPPSYQLRWQWYVLASFPFCSLTVQQLIYYGLLSVSKRSPENTTTSQTLYFLVVWLP